MKNQPFVEERDSRWYKPCALCGARVMRSNANEICRFCMKNESHKSPYTGRRSGLRIKYSGDKTRCKMPRCRKEFELERHQDRRFTWYCPECREQIAEITDGIQWHSRMGIEFVVGEDGEEIIQDSLAKAYEEKEVNP